MFKNLAKLALVSTVTLFLAGCFTAKSINEDAQTQVVPAEESVAN